MQKRGQNFKYDVSIVLTTHHEGLILHPTLRSLARSIEFANKSNLSVELIVILDRPNKATSRYLNEQLAKVIKGVPTVLKEVNLGDPGAARNQGVRLAQGRVVGNFDADDLFSENIIKACAEEVLSSERPTIVHPEYIVSFGIYNEIWHIISSTSKDFGLLPAIVEYNLFPGPSFAANELRQLHPYKPGVVERGFGPEDRQWNVDTLSEGIAHAVGSNTAYFYRRKLTDSVLSIHNASHLLVEPNGIMGNNNLAKTFVHMFNDDAVASRGDVRPNEPSKRTKRTIAQKASVAPRFVLAKTGRAVGPVLRLHPRTRGFEHYARLAFSELLATSAPDSPPQTHKAINIPMWLVDEWKAQHQFEHSLFPDKDLLRRIHQYTPEIGQYSVEYWSLLHQIYVDADYVLLVPWLRDGGADLVVLNYVNAILDLNPNAKIVILATEPSESTLLEQLPRSVKFVALGEKFHQLLHEQKTEILATLLIQSRAKRVHIVNSSLGFSLYETYAPALSRHMKLYISVFAVDILPSGKRVHRALDGMPNYSEYLTKVFSDNGTIVDKFINWQAYPDDLFSVHYQPFRATKLLKAINSVRVKSETLHILWAGRLDREKHPEILIKIAEECKARNIPVAFDVYGSPLLGDDTLLEQVKNCPLISYKGPYSKGLATLPLESYDLFLMTSEYEGMPNVVLEAISGGLAVMAPMVGGIPETVTDQTGFPVHTYNDVTEYVERLGWINQHRMEIDKRLKQAQILINERHSWQSFLETLKHESGYIDTTFSK